MRASKIPASGSDRGRKRRTGFLRRVKAGINAAARRETVIIGYVILDLLDDGIVNGSILIGLTK